MDELNYSSDHYACFYIRRPCLEAPKLLDLAFRHCSSLAGLSSYFMMSRRGTRRATTVSLLGDPVLPFSKTCPLIIYGTYQWPRDAPLSKKLSSNAHSSGYGETYPLYVSSCHSLTSTVWLPNLSLDALGRTMERSHLPDKS